VQMYESGIGSTTATNTSLLLLEVDTTFAL
jgi:hypothetical protein